MHCQKKGDLCKMQQNLNVSYPFERNSLLDIVRNISHFFLKIVDKRLIALNNLSTMDSLPQ